MSQAGITTGPTSLASEPANPAGGQLARHSLGKILGAAERLSYEGKRACRLLFIRIDLAPAPGLGMNDVNRRPT